MSTSPGDVQALEGKIERSMETLSNSITALAQQMAEQTNQLNLVGQKLDLTIQQHEHLYKRLETNQIEQGRTIAALSRDVEVLKSKQSGVLAILKDFGTPLVTAALLSALILKGP